MHGRETERETSTENKRKLALTLTFTKWTISGAEIITEDKRTKSVWGPGCTRTHLGSLPQTS